MCDIMRFMATKVFDFNTGNTVTDSVLLVIKSHDGTKQQPRITSLWCSYIGLHIEVLGLVTYSVCNILRTPTATKPKTSDGRLTHIVCKRILGRYLGTLVAVSVTYIM